MERAEPTLRVAAPADEDAIGALMKESITSLFPLCYDSRQTESAVRYIGDVDRTLVTAAARDEGFVQLALMATLPGVPLYAAYGFRPLEEVEITMPDGVTLACMSMDKRIEA